MLINGMLNYCDAGIGFADCFSGNEFNEYKGLIMWSESMGMEAS